ncbi:MAG: ATP-binding protein [Trueperaceae bacterium]|nr:ATP-binding protein [Trueperaceae bacterium]
MSARLDAVAALPAWFDALEDGVITVSDGRVTALNRAAATLLQVDPAAVVGLPLIATVRDHRLEHIYLNGGEAELTARQRVLYVKALPGGLLLRDISAERRAQESARELLAVLSHELRTPVTAIRSTLEAFHYDLPAAQRQRFLARAEAEADRLVRLLDDLTVDVKPPRLRRVLLSEVSDRALALLQDTFAEHDVRVDDAVPPLTVYADVDKLLQVFINLLENAAVHGPDHATVYLRADLDPDDPNRVRVCVRDEGSPLEPDVIETLFEPHARGRTRRAKGSGLGLYIVRSIAQRWGGDAWGRALDDGNEFGFSVSLLK